MEIAWSTSFCDIIAIKKFTGHLVKVQCSVLETRYFLFSYKEIKPSPKAEDHEFFLEKQRIEVTGCEKNPVIQFQDTSTKSLFCEFLLKDQAHCRHACCQVCVTSKSLLSDTCADFEPLIERFHFKSLSHLSQYVDWRDWNQPRARTHSTHQ